MSHECSNLKEKPGKKLKTKYRPKFQYDQLQLDQAVYLVLNNKLSLRAASYIYNIPFSTLRSRKISNLKNKIKFVFDSKSETNRMTLRFNQERR